MVQLERLQIILDLAPFDPDQLIKSVEIDDKSVTITALEPSGRSCTMVESNWSMPVKSNKSDEHTLG